MSTGAAMAAELLVTTPIDARIAAAARRGFGTASRLRDGRRLVAT
jgi:hypothetical protein